jgi:hypothetical protein
VVRGRRIRRQMQYGEEEEYEYRDEVDDDYANPSRDNDGDNTKKAPDHLLAAAGLEDSDADDDMVSFFFLFGKAVISFIFWHILMISGDHSHFLQKVRFMFYSVLQGQPQSAIERETGMVRI